MNVNKDSIKTQKIHRNDLYKKVWETPMSRLASDYGISDVALAKICKKLNVPRPPRGYWAKLQYGKKISKPPLPAIDPNEQSIHEINIIPNDKNVIQKKDIQVEKLIPTIKSEKIFNVSKRLISPHPLIQKAEKFLMKQNTNGFGILFSPRKKCLDIRVSPKSLNRALRIIDTVIKAFEIIGNKIILVDRESRSSITCVEINGERIPFYIKEIIQRIDHIPTKEEIRKQKEWEYFSPRRWDYLPTGNLTLNINVWQATRTRKKWSDTSSNKLDNQIKDFIEGTFVIAEILRQNRIKDEEERAKLEEKRRIQKEEENRQKAEEEQYKNLEIEAELWAKSQQLRKYIKAIENIAVHPKCSEELKGKIEKFSKWAKEHANNLDPLTNGLPFGFDPYDNEKS